MEENGEEDEEHSEYYDEHMCTKNEQVKSVGISVSLD